MYYLIKENETLLITTNSEDFGADTNAVLIDSDKDLRELSKEAFNGLIEDRDVYKNLKDTYFNEIQSLKKDIEQLSEQLQQLNFSK